MKALLFERRLREALGWIVRLPLLGDIELGQLMAIREIDARALRTELARRGWVGWIIPHVPELNEGRRAAFVRAEALADLAACSGFPIHEIERRAPVREADLLERIPRIALITGVNWFLAKLAAELRERGEMGFEDACSVPLSSTRPWWPVGVDAYGVVRGTRGAARFFIAWDRAGAPDSFRRDRIKKLACGSAASDPSPIFVVCANARSKQVWNDALQRWADVPEVRLTTAEEILASGPRGNIWSIPESPARLWFEQALLSWSTDVTPLLTFHASMAVPERQCKTPSVRERATLAAAVPRDRSVRERVATLAIRTSVADKSCLDWLGRHPRLSARELACFLDLPLGLITRRLELLAAIHAVRRLEVEGIERWCITEWSLRLLANAEGVSWRRYERDGGVKAPSVEEDAATRPSMVHQLGIIGVFARLVGDARTAGWQLVDWRNETGSGLRFRYEGRDAWIKPDGSGVLRGGKKEERPFLLEYDCGTLDAGDYRGKFAGLVRYFAATGWRAQFDREPLLLFVCSDQRAEDRVRTAVIANGAAHLPILLTAEWRARTVGLMGSIWREAEAEHRRGLLRTSGVSPTAGHADGE